MFIEKTALKYEPIYIATFDIRVLVHKLKIVHTLSTLLNIT